MSMDVFEKGDLINAGTKTYIFLYSLYGQFF